MKKLAIGAIIFMWLSRFVALAFVVLLVVGALVFAGNPQPAPKVDKAPYGIQTYTGGYPSRAYYAQEVRLEGNVPVITDYWTYDGKNFKFNKGEKEFPPTDYSYVQVVDRRK